ncbi:MAG: hypothetical protein HBSAPP03_09950 [Phycisphaerae bacterium]|nr:MAG: hypothetical protein HBSAPP03_09950 [Phycisphaerae bacterium]
MKRTLSLVLSATLAPAAFAGVYTESGDAHELVPQPVVGTNPITAIQGALSAASNDYADLFSIYISNPAAFSASTVGGATFDTQLFLFDADGRGVSHNDDAPGGGSLQSRLTGAFVPGPGVYWLAISPYNRDPSSGFGLIWNNSPFNTERAPDGPGAASALLSWAGTGTTGSYTIELTGVVAVPAPGPLLLAALGGLLVTRRVRTSPTR